MKLDLSDTDSLIAAFSDEQVERLTALITTQLRYRDRTGFYAGENRRMAYSRINSFKDVVSLGTSWSIASIPRCQKWAAVWHAWRVAALAVGCG
jgi:hypothetical protein